MSDHYANLRELGRKAGQDWPENGAVEIRRNEEPLGTIDEIVVESASVHIEQMGDGSYWMGITAKGELWQFWFTCRGKMKLTGGFDSTLAELDAPTHAPRVRRVGGGSKPPAPAKP